MSRYTAALAALALIYPPASAQSTISSALDMSSFSSSTSSISAGADVSRTSCPGSIYGTGASAYRCVGAVQQVMAAGTKDCSTTCSGDKSNPVQRATTPQVCSETTIPSTASGYGSLAAAAASMTSGGAGAVESSAITTSWGSSATGSNGALLARAAPPAAAMATSGALAGAFMAAGVLLLAL